MGYPIHYKSPVGFPFAYNEHCQDGTRTVQELLELMFPYTSADFDSRYESS